MSDLEPSELALSVSSSAEVYLKYYAAHREAEGGCWKREGSKWREAVRAFPKPEERQHPAMDSGLFREGTRGLLQAAPALPLCVPLSKQRAILGAHPCAFASQPGPATPSPTNLQRKDLVRAQGCEGGA